MLTSLGLRPLVWVRDLNVGAMPLFSSKAALGVGVGVGAQKDVRERYCPDAFSFRLLFRHILKDMSTFK